MTTTFSTDRNLDEPKALQRQIHEKKTSILDSTRRMLGLVNESEVIGTNTAAELKEQGEKLENISKRCDGIDANLVNAQQNINRLGSIFGGIKNYFNPPKSSFPKSISQPQLSSSTQKTTVTTVSRPTDLKDNHDTYFGKRRDEMDDIERETEEGLHDIHLGVSRLKQLAIHMNEELTRQDPIINGLDHKIERLNENVKKKNKIMNEIVLR